MSLSYINGVNNMIFEDQKFDLTDKELDFAKSNPELFGKYLDYCNNSLDVKKKMVDAHVKELNLDASRAETNREFWKNLAAIGVTGFLEWVQKEIRND